MDIKALLTRKLRVGSLELPNRVAMAPMTRALSPAGVPTAAVAEYYARRARHGVGLIITEGTPVNHRAACPDPNIPRMHGEEALAGWARVVEAVHAAGGKIIPQLWHWGIAGELPAGFVPAGPSGLSVPGGPQVVEPMSKDDIRDVVKAFAQAAADAKRVGFDGVEIHGAHGYLVDQFFWAGTNVRTDEYGGSSLAQRAKFAAEIVRAIREAVGPEFPIVLRWSQWKVLDFNARIADTPEELGAFLKVLSDAGVDMFHCSTRRFWEPAFAGSPLTLAGWARKLVNKPTIAVGSVGLDLDMLGTRVGSDQAAGIFVDTGIGLSSLEKLSTYLGNEEFDVIAIGRALITDPEWVDKVVSGRHEELLPYSKAALATLA